MSRSGLVLETIPLSPVDADPESPATRSFTTTLAGDGELWYRLIFRDADGDEQQATLPVQNVIAGPTYSTVTELARTLQIRNPTDAQRDAMTTRPVRGRGRDKSRNQSRRRRRARLRRASTRRSSQSATRRGTLGIAGGPPRPRRDRRRVRDVSLGAELLGEIRVHARRDQAAIRDRVTRTLRRPRGYGRSNPGRRRRRGRLAGDSSRGVLDSEPDSPVDRHLPRRSRPRGRRDGRVRRDGRRLGSPANGSTSALESRRTTLRRISYSSSSYAIRSRTSRSFKRCTTTRRSEASSPTSRSRVNPGSGRSRRSTAGAFHLGVLWLFLVLPARS